MSPPRWMCVSISLLPTPRRWPRSAQPAGPAGGGIPPAAALAGSDAARLSFYPTLSLQGTLSAGSQLFHQWFNDPLRTVGSSVSAPFIQWNTVQLTVEQASVKVQQEAVNFRRTAIYRAVGGGQRDGEAA